MKNNEARPKFTGFIKKKACIGKTNFKLSLEILSDIVLPYMDLLFAILKTEYRYHPSHNYYLPVIVNVLPFYNYFLL